MLEPAERRRKLEAEKSPSRPSRLMSSSSSAFLFKLRSFRSQGLSYNLDACRGIGNILLKHSRSQVDVGVIQNENTPLSLQVDHAPTLAPSIELSHVVQP